MPAPSTIWDVALRKRLGGSDSHFDLDVAFATPASRLVMFGPSGAGKTLTLKMMAGLTTPDHGRTRIAGRVLFDSAEGIDLRAQRRRLGFVFQDYALFPHLTVRQNIAFAQPRAGRNWLNPSQAAAKNQLHPPQSAAVDAVERWIDAFGLRGVTGHHPHQLSGGQRQRTALARALVSHPDALLLDEPFAALDRALRHSLRDELLDLQAQVALPMLLITHDDEDVLAWAQQVVVLEAGKGRLRGGPERSTG